MQIVKTFENLYACKLFIVKYEDIEDTSYIGNNFIFHKGNDLVDGSRFDDILKEDKESAHAAVYSVRRKKDGILGVLLVIYEDITTEHVAHEAVHIADYFCEFSGITTQDFSEGNEHYAYLVGWAAGCIAKVLTDKSKRK